MNDNTNTGKETVSVLNLDEAYIYWTDGSWSEVVDGAFNEDSVLELDWRDVESDSVPDNIQQQVIDDLSNIDPPGTVVNITAEMQDFPLDEEDPSRSPESDQDD